MAKAFTLLEVIVALLMSSLLLLVVQRAHFFVTRNIDRNVSPEIVLMAEGLKRQIENLSTDKFTFQGKKVTPFFLWNEEKLAFVTKWGLFAPLLVCYRRIGNNWYYMEAPLNNYKIPDNYCENPKAYLPQINIKIIDSDQEKISEINPGQKGKFILILKGISYERMWTFNL